LSPRKRGGENVLLLRGKKRQKKRKKKEERKKQDRKDNRRDHLLKGDDKTTGAFQERPPFLGGKGRGGLTKGGANK